MKGIFTVLFISVFANLGFCQIGFEQHEVINNTYGTINPRSVISADIDGDGYKDVVVSGWSDIMWYKNQDGSGNYANTQPIYTNNYTIEQVGVADIDGDSDTDIIFLADSSGGMQLMVAKNSDGSGTFDPPVLLFTFTITYFVRFQPADMDGDNDMDIAFGNNGYIGWLENDGTGGFTTHAFLGNNNTSSGPYESFFVIDVDGDNRQDLIVDLGYDLRAYKHNTDGTLTFLETMTTFAQGSFISGGDLDNDGDNDIVMIFENGGNDRKIQWYQNTNGAGSFADRQTIVPLPNLPVSSSSDVKSLQLADVDNDGLLDIVFLESRTEKVSYYKNLGNVVFDTETLVSDEFIDVRAMYADDLDGDGTLDIITASTLDSQVSWFKNTDGAGSFSNELFISTYANYINHVDTGDIDGDGFPDLISSSHADNKLAWYRNTNGLGDFSEKQKIISKTVPAPRDAFLADMNGDGYKDVLAFSYVDDMADVYKILWLENDGAGNFIQEHIIESTSDMIVHINYADVDGDGDMDVISAENNSVLSLYKNNGNGTFQPQEIFSEPGFAYPLCLQLADIDGDDDIDVLASYNNDEIVWYENANGLGGFATKHVIISQMHYPISVYAADLDGDNDKDVLFANYYQNQIGYFLNLDGVGTFGDKVVIPDSPNHPGAVYGLDADADGDMDVVTNWEQGSKLVWYQNDGSANFGEAIEITVNTARVNCIVSADLNNDSKPDLVTSSYDNDQIAWYENLGIYSNVISGTIRLDANADGCTPEDAPMEGIMVTTTNGVNSFATFTGANGHYTLPANQEVFTTGISTSLPAYYSANPANYTFDFTNSTGTTATSDFCVEADEAINNLTVSVYPFMSDPRPGFPTHYQLIYKNTGTVPLDGSVTFEYDNTRLTFQMASEPVSSQNGNILTFDFTGLNPFEVKTVDLDFQVMAPPAANIGEILTATATINPIPGDLTPDDNTFVLAETIIGSYDPNDITVLEGSEILLEDADEYLHYIIRFQNTGTADAINVRVQNSLDTKLDWTTLQLESMSHEGEVLVTDGLNIEFVFNNIHLPDSNTDEANSHGYIAYKIKPVSTVVLNDIIYNTADIYFDFNTAITTNTVETQLVDVLGSDAFVSNLFKVYPNPANSMLYVKSDKGIDNITVYDINGRLLLAETVTESKEIYPLNIQSLQKGIYLIKVGYGKQAQMQKFVKL